MAVEKKFMLYVTSDKCIIYCVLLGRHDCLADSPVTFFLESLGYVCVALERIWPRVVILRPGFRKNRVALMCTLLKIEKKRIIISIKHQSIASKK